MQIVPHAERFACANASENNMSHFGKKSLKKVALLSEGTGLFSREAEVDNKVLWFVNIRLLINHLKTCNLSEFYIKCISY